MARPRKRRSAVQLTPGQAAYVLQRLVKERRVSAGDVNRYVAEMSEEIGALERRLQELRAASGAVAAAVSGGGPKRRRSRNAGAEAAPAKAKTRAKRKKAITPEQLASRKLQGRYLGLVRQFTPAKRVYFARLAKEKGREAAIKEMLDARK